MAVYRDHLDKSRENLLSMKEAIPKVIEGLKSGEITPGFNSLFSPTYDDDGLFSVDLNRDKPCCTMGHVIKTAGLEHDITRHENEQMPAVLFNDTDMCAAVNEVAASNDADYLEHSKWIADIIHDLEKLEGTINEVLERT